MSSIQVGDIVVIIKGPNKGWLGTVGGVYNGSMTCTVIFGDGGRIHFWTDNLHVICGLSGHEIGKFYE